MTRCVQSHAGVRATRYAAMAASTCMLAGACIADTATNAPFSELAFRPTAEIDDTTVLLEDIADVSALPDGIRAAAAHVVVLDLRPSTRSVSVDALRVAETARRQLPVLTPWLTNIAPRTIRISRRDGPSSDGAGLAARPCIELLRDLEIGSALPANQFRPVPCSGDETHRAWRYDTSAHVARANRPLRSGDIVIAPAAQRSASVIQGNVVTRDVRLGAITVTRSGITLGDTSRNRAATVRTADGSVTTWRNVQESGEQ